MMSKKHLIFHCPFSLLLLWIIFFVLSFKTIPLSAEGGGEIPVWPHEKSDLKPDPAVIYGKLPNGFRYAVMPNKKPEGRVSMHLNIQAGSLHETEDQQGLAHFLEHMLFNGTEHFAPGELVKYFQRIGMKFGPDANAHTAFTETVYDILLPQSDKKSIEEALLVLHDYAQGALLLPEEIDRERRVILAEKMTRDSISYRTFVSTIKFELPGTRIADRMPIGEEEVLRTAGKDRLKSYYDTWYRPGKMILVMVGDMDPDLAVSLIEAKFSDMKPRAPEKGDPEPGKFDHDGVKAFYHYEEEAGNTKVGIEAAQYAEPVDDSFALQKKILLRHMAHSIVDKRLDAMLKKPDTPFSSASIGSGLYLDVVDYAEISAETKPENWEKTLTAIETTLRQALEHGFSEAEAARIQQEYMAMYERAAKAAETRESSHLARGLIRSMNKNRVFQSPQQELALFVPVIESATAETLHQEMKETWAQDHRLVLITGNAKIQGEEEIQGKAELSPEDRILAAFKTSLAQAVEKPAKIRAVSFPYLDAPEKPGKIAEKKVHEDLGITQITFENGMLLNLKPTDFSANQVLVNLCLGEGGRSEPASDPGLSELSESVVNQSGLGELDKDELDRALAGKNISVRFSVDEERFCFSGQAVSDEVGLLFSLLYAHLQDPAFREPAYGLMMERYRQQYLALSRSVDGAILLQVKKFLAGGDSRFGLPPFDQFEKLTLEDVKKWLAGPISTAPLELSVVGDFDPEAVMDLAALYMGSLNRKKSDPAVQRDAPVFPDGGELTLEVITQIPKGVAMVAYPTDDIWDIHRTRRLSATASLFSDRLRENIREKLGAAYSPVAYSAPSRAYPDYGTFQVMVYIDPADADMVIREVKMISKKLAEDGVSEDELRRAVDPIVTGIRDMRKQNSYWLDTVLTGTREHPEQIEWSRTIVEDYTSITPGDVEKMVETYLKNEKAAEVIVLPAIEPGEVGGEGD